MGSQRGLSPWRGWRASLVSELSTLSAPGGVFCPVCLPRPQHAVGLSELQWGGGQFGFCMFRENSRELLCECPNGTLTQSWKPQGEASS